MNTVRHIPNALTVCNLLCGCVGIAFLYDHPPRFSAYFVWAAVAFDFFDGYVARWTTSHSALGKQLDSLADMVSFGVLPTLMVMSQLNALLPSSPLVYGSLVIAACAALRLAKFNIDAKQEKVFVGLPTPSAALFITGLPFLPPALSEPFDHAEAWLGASIATALLMVAPVRLFSLKIEKNSIAKNKIQIIFIGIAALWVAFQQAGAVSPVILLYVALSLADPSTRKGTENSA